MGQKSKTQKCNKTQNSNCDTTQIKGKLKNSKYDNSKTKIATTLKKIKLQQNQNCEKT